MLRIAARGDSFSSIASAHGRWSERKGGNDNDGDERSWRCAREVPVLEVPRRWRKEKKGDEEHCGAKEGFEVAVHVVMGWQSRLK